MLCPYCRIEYTAEEPCFCQSPATTQQTKPATSKSQGPKGYIRAVFRLREGNRYSFHMEVFRDGNASEILVPHEGGSATATISIHRGLCSTCRNDPTCTYSGNSGRPLLQCEEFDGELMGTPDPTDRNNPPSDSLELRSPSGEKYSNNYAGLCKLCDSSEICTFPKPEGGVWHCDEYELVGSQHSP